MSTVTTDVTASAPVQPAHKQPDKIEDLAAPKVEDTNAPKDESLAPKYAAFARKEKMLRQMKRDLDAREQALTAKEAPKAPAQPDWKQRIGQDFWSVMTEAGLSPDQVTQAMLNQPKAEDVQFQKLQNEIKELRAAQEQSTTQAQKAQDEQYQQAKKQIKTEVTLLVDGDDSYEAIKAHGEVAKDAVVDLIEQVFKEEGYVMDVNDAVREVEEHLLEQALTLARLKKVQSKLNPPTPETVEAQKTPLPQKTPAPQTLTNRVAVTQSRGLTEKDRRDRAVAAFMGNKP